MASFSYVAYDVSGKEKKGSIEAEDQNRATAMLKKDGLIVSHISEQSMMTKDISFSIAKKVKPRDLSVFCRQFVSIINAGVTITDALSMLGEQTENPSMAAAIKDVESNIRKGETLSRSMRMHPKVFPALLVNMVAAGEASGSLEVSLERMAIQYEKDSKIQGMVKKAMVYPIIVIVVAIVVVIVMLTFVVPTFMSMFEDMDIEMPKITLAVMAASNWMQKYWYLLIGIIAVLVVGFGYFKKTPTGEGLIGWLGMKIPIISNFTIKSAASRFARTMSTLMYAGIPMIEALDITANSMSNIFFKRLLREAKDSVRQGIPVSTPIIKSGLFPSMVGHMVKIGEETGDLGAMLEKLADYYDEEVEAATQQLMAALEPMIIILLAGVCGTIVGAVMAPMAAMYTGLENL